MEHYIVEKANNAWHVFETTTAQIVGKFQSEKDSIDYRKFLMLGGAFDGYTPSFILNHMVKKLPDINSELETLFNEKNTTVRM
jgi:hypothetical protein